MVEWKQAILTKDDVRNIRIWNYRNLDNKKWHSQLTIEINTGDPEMRETIRVLLTEEQQKNLYKKLKKALNK
jgi:3'-phosphoadenosine 5'-phosphosulfate sulfotransferase